MNAMAPWLQSLDTIAKQSNCLAILMEIPAEITTAAKFSGEIRKQTDELGLKINSAGQ